MSLKVTLFEYQDTQEVKNSYAYIENERLVEDKWIMGKRIMYENESFIYIERVNIVLLCYAMETVRSEDFELLQRVEKKFNGVDGFETFRCFLDFYHIPYSSNYVSH